MMIFNKNIALTIIFTLYLICKNESKPVTADVNDFYEFLGGNEDFLNNRNNDSIEWVKRNESINSLYSINEEVNQHNLSKLTSANENTTSSFMMQQIIDLAFNKTVESKNINPNATWIKDMSIFNLNYQFVSLI